MRTLSATVMAADPGAELGAHVLRAYLDDVVSRYRRRQATPGEVDEAMRAEPSDDLVFPTGLFVLAIVGGEPAGCGGVRLMTHGIAELTRVWVVPVMRRQGLGTQLVTHLEHHALDQGMTRIRLDTRSDLTEARALYRRLGYREVAPFNEGPYAEHWFEKAL